MEAALCVLAAACIPLFAWLGHREDVRRARSESLPCRCGCDGRTVILSVANGSLVPGWNADDLAEWNMPNQVP